MRLLTDRAIVAVLYEQRPDHDARVVRASEEHIAAYRKGLLQQTPDLNDTQSPRSQLFTPSAAILWGQHDFGHFYLADDLESVHALSYASGARSEEYLIGTPYQADGDLATHFFAPEFAAERPAVAVCRIKLGDHLLAAYGGDFISAVAHAVRQVCGADVSALVSRCWAWPELLVLLQSALPLALFQAVERVEGLRLDELTDSRFRDVFSRSLDASPGGMLLSRWLGDQIPDEARLARLGQCNAIVAVRTQFGLLEAGWAKAARLFPEGFRDIVHSAFGTAIAPREFGELGRAAADLRLAFDAARETAPLGFRARVVLRPKPGHMRYVERAVSELTAALPDGTVTIAGSEQSEAAIQLSVPVSLEGLACLLAVSQFFRLCPKTRRHFESTSTSIEWAHSGAASQGQEVEFADIPGYNVLARNIAPGDLTLDRRIAHIRGFGRVETTTFMSWYRSVVNMGNRPDMLSSLAYLHACAVAAYRQLENAPPSHDGTVRAASSVIAQYGLQSYQQRIQHSPALQGAPPINGQTPVGMNQIMSMVDGVWATIAQAAFLTGTGRDNLDAEGRDSIVLFGTQSGVSTRAALHVTIIHLSLVQATTPLSYSLLFHELGHLIVRRRLWEATAGNEENRVSAFDRVVGEWVTSVEALAKKVASYDGPMPADGPDRLAEWERDVEPILTTRVADFIEDVFSHAVWRRIGCGNALSLFETQFMAGHAMGLYTSSLEMRPHDRVAMDVWAESAAHLALQRALVQTRDQFRAACELISRNSRHFFDAALEAVWPYAQCEVAREFAMVSGPIDLIDDEAKRAFYANARSRWLVILHALAHEVRSPPYRTLRSEMSKLLGSLDPISDEIENAEPPAMRDLTPTQIFAKIEDGTFFQSVGHSMLLPGGCPTAEAIAVVRLLLRAVTRDFEAQGGTSVRCVARGEDMRLLHPAGSKTGVFTDMGGGVWVAGKADRQQYLRARAAAVQGLADVSQRVSAGRVAARLRTEVPGPMVEVGAHGKLVN